jgi:hypothetical protein
MDLVVVRTRLIRTLDTGFKVVHVEVCPRKKVTSTVMAVV